jgi:hypothetical protein
MSFMRSGTLLPQENRALFDLIKTVGLTLVNTLLDGTSWSFLADC